MCVLYKQIIIQNVLLGSIYFYFHFQHFAAFLIAFAQSGYQYGRYFYFILYKYFPLIKCIMFTFIHTFTQTYQVVSHIFVFTEHFQQAHKKFDDTFFSMSFI